MVYFLLSVSRFAVLVQTSHKNLSACWQRWLCQGDNTQCGKKLAAPWGNFVLFCWGPVWQQGCWLDRFQMLFWGNKVSQYQIDSNWAVVFIFYLFYFILMFKHWSYFWKHFGHLCCVPTAGNWFTTVLTFGEILCSLYFQLLFFYLHPKMGVCVIISVAMLGWAW